MLSDRLLVLLVCPKTKKPLIYFPRGEADLDESEGFLFAPSSLLRYRIDEGVPVLLVDEGILLTPSASEALLARARQLGLVSP